MVKAKLVLCGADMLTEAEREAAQKLQESHPRVVEAVKRWKEVEGRARGVYLTLVTELRRSKLSRSEALLLLRSLGWNKERSSELRRVSECDEEQWEKLRSGQSSFRQTLALERGKGKRPGGRRGATVEKSFGKLTAPGEEWLPKFEAFAPLLVGMPRGRAVQYESVLAGVGGERLRVRVLGVVEFYAVAPRNVAPA